jgi:FixJ family two-component response regulator
MKRTIENSREKTAPLVCVVDDDESMREALESLLKSVGYCTAIFASAQDFLQANERNETNCLILDLRMPGMNGLELQQRLVAENSRLPIVFISANSESGEKEQALAGGAIDFLYKPFSEDSLLGAVRAAINNEAV